MRNLEFGMRNLQKRITVLAMVMLFGVAVASAAERTWTRSEILAIADKEAQRLGYDVEQMSVSFDVYNSKWLEYLEMATNVIPYPEGQAKLKDRDYLAVYYARMEVIVGGDLWVFIDLNTGEIIDSIRGE